jgi:hypothetical protein
MKYNNQMKKKIVILGLGAVISFGLFMYTTWGQAAPVTRDPDIGGGLIGLAAIVVAIFSILGLALEFINSRKRSH